MNSNDLNAKSGNFKQGGHPDSNGDAKVSSPGEESFGNPNNASLPTGDFADKLRKELGEARQCEVRTDQPEGAAAGACWQGGASDVPVRFPLPPTQRGPLGKLGPYHIEMKILDGGFGTVFKAWDEDNERDVAIKVIRRAIDRARFKFEARAACAVRNDHVVGVLHIGVMENTHWPFIVMDYIKGESLADKLRRVTKLPPEEAATIAHQIAIGLAAAWERMLVHRDIKPSNILLDRIDGRAKIIDFGLACRFDGLPGATVGLMPAHAEPHCAENKPNAASHWIGVPDANLDGMPEGDANVDAALISTPLQVKPSSDDQASGSSEHSLSIAGTFPYMSPEQHSTDRLDGRSDIYSLGVVLFQTLTGEFPFQQNNEKDVADAKRTQNPPSPCERDPAIPKDLDAITRKCLAANPESRYSDARALADDLHRFLNMRPIRARDYPVTELLWFWARRNPGVARLSATITALVLIALVCASAAAYIFASQRDVIAEQRDRIGEGKDRAEQDERTARRIQYVAEFSTLNRDVGSLRYADAHRYLEQSRPQKPDDFDFRGWEWFHMYRLLHSETARFDGHVGTARVAVFSPNPETHRAASAGDDGLIHVWDSDTGRELRRLGPLDDTVFDLAFSPDGLQVAAACADSTAVVFDINGAYQPRRLIGHLLALNAVAFRPDGKVVATGGADNVIKLWDAETGNELATLVGHTHEVQRLWFCDDGQRLASVGQDDVLRFWKLANGEYEQDADAAVNRVDTPLALSRDFSKLCFWEKGSLVVREAATDKPLFKLTMFKQPPRDLFFNSDASLLGTVDADGTAAVLDCQTRRFKSYQRGLAETIALSPTGDRFVSACSDDRVRIWPTVKSDYNWFKGHDANVERIAFHPNGQIVATGDMAGSIRIWNSRTGEPIRTLGIHIAEKGPPDTPPPPELTKMQEMKKRLVAIQTFNPGSRDPKDPDTVRRIHVYAGHGAAIVSLAFSPDGSILASASGNSEVLLWNIDNDAELRMLRHPQRTSSLAFSPDGKQLVTGCWDDAVRVWYVASGTEIRTLRGHEDNVNAVVFHPDGEHVASAGLDHVVRVWDVATGKERRKLEGHTDRIHALAISPDGRLLASGGDDRTIRIWDFNEGRLMQVLHGHTSRVTSLVFHPIQKDRLASACNDEETDGTCRIWDLKSGRELLAIPEEGIDGLAFDASGDRLAVTNGRRIKIWEATEPEKAVADPPPPAVASRVRDHALSDAELAPRVLGYQQRKELPKILRKDQIEPSDHDNELIVVVLSVPHGLLYPNVTQEESLRQRRRQDGKKDPVGPPRSYALYDPKRFGLLLPSGRSVSGFAVAPMPATGTGERGDGFSKDIIVVSSTTLFDPHDRAILSVAFELPPRDLAGRFVLQWQTKLGATLADAADTVQSVAVPPRTLEAYRGRHSRDRSRRNTSDGSLQLSGVTNYFVLERNP